jgi:hypothetical protein
VDADQLTQPCRAASSGSQRLQEIPYAKITKAITGRAPSQALIRITPSSLSPPRSTMAEIDHDTEVMKIGQDEVIERASGDDVKSLVADRHDTPMQVGAVLLLDVVTISMPCG